MPVRALHLVLAAMAVSGVAGCNTSTSSSASPPTVPASRMSAAPTASPATRPGATKSTPVGDEWNRCGPNRDVIVRSVAPNLPPSAQVLGAYNLGTCKRTLDDLQLTSPTDPGYCTQAAWANDNPGYNADRTPAARLNKVIESIGPAC